ncbi:sulfatase-like hydrolase/transferase, partial [Desulfovibrio sp. OttesenSCG-928-C14]|nr:sulfatase-like hydrolase/transferase [Desulfovibrio sp. OttesenSCG-928-C14]
MNNVWRLEYYLGAAMPCVLLALCAVVLAWSRVARSGDGRRGQLLFPCLAFSVLLGLMILASFSGPKMSTPLRVLYSALNASDMALLVFWFFTQRPVATVLLRLAGYFGRRLQAGTPDKLFAASIFVYALLIFFYHPVVLFHSDPEFFANPLPALLGELFFRLLVLVGACAFIYRNTGFALRPFMAVAATWLAICSLLHSFVFIFDYGEMNGPFLQYSSKFTSLGAVASDVTVFLISTLLLWLVLRRAWGKVLAGMIQSFCAVVLLAGAVQIFTSENQEEEAELIQNLPSYYERLFSFSREGRNIMLVVLDAFTGDHMEKLLAEEPELMGNFTGFTWYADNISPSRCTITSMAALMGGEHYLPVEINRRGDKTLIEEINEAHTVLPGLLFKEDYDVALVNMEKLNENSAQKFCPRISDALITHTAGRDFVHRWLDKNGYEILEPPNQANFMSIFGLFRASPSLLRKHIYRRGTWMHTYAVMSKGSSGWYAMFEAMGELATADSGKSTYKAIHSMITHDPWDLDADCVPVTDRHPTAWHKDGYMVEHYWAERCALRTIAGLLQRLKANGTYDNTQIIILSDHGYRDNIGHGKTGGPYEDAIRSANALLLVKNFNEKHPLVVDRQTPTSSVDVLALVCRAGGFCSGIDYYDPFAGQS